MRHLAIALGLVVVGACGDNLSEPPALPEVTDPVSLVDPTIGTGGLGFAHGSCFVGAAMPHGLVKVGPDTSGPFGVVNFLHYSGYWSGDDKIRGFSHLHLHGAGATDYGVLSLMPALAFDPGKTTVADYEAKFTKANEHAAAGRYEVTLTNGINVVLSATERAAVHRYTGAGALVIDLDKTLSGGEVDAASITLDAPAREITGQLHHRGGMSGGFGGYTVYFVAKANAAWSTSHVWAAGMPASSTLLTATGTEVGAALAIPADFQIAVGVSFVSLAGARANLATEVPAIDVEVVAAAARAKWSTLLERVLITGGSETQRRIFYTSLYHAFLMPTATMSSRDRRHRSARLAGARCRTCRCGTRTGRSVRSTRGSHPRVRAISHVRSSASARVSVHIRDGRSRSARPARCSVRARRS